MSFILFLSSLNEAVRPFMIKGDLIFIFYVDNVRYAISFLSAALRRTDF